MDGWGWQAKFYFVGGSILSIQNSGGGVDHKFVKKLLMGGGVEKYAPPAPSLDPGS